MIRAIIKYLHKKGLNITGINNDKYWIKDLCEKGLHNYCIDDPYDPLARNLQSWVFS